MPENKTAEKTFQNADADLATAYLILNNPKQNLYGIACFHIHQAVEKYLKGYLLAQNEKPPLIHDLKILLDNCTEHDSRLAKFAETCKELNPYYIETRYEPGSPEEFNRDEAQELYKKAENLINHLKSNLL